MSEIMTPYQARIVGAGLPSIDPKDAAAIVDEFRRVERGVLTTQEAVRTIPVRRPVYLPFQTGANSGSANTNIEPTVFGAAGSLLESYGTVNVDAIRGNGTIVGLRLIASCEAHMSPAAATGFIKVGVKLHGSTFVRYSPARGLSGSTTYLFFDFDLISFLPEFKSGDLFGCFAVWRTTAAGLAIIGSGAPSPLAASGVLVEVVDP